MKDWKELRRAFRHSKATGDYEAASGYLREAISACIEIDPTEAALLWNCLANLRFEIGDFAGAEEAARRSVVVEQEFGMPPLESDALGSYNSLLGSALEKQGRYSEALQYIEQSLAIFRLHAKEDEPLIQNISRFREEIKAKVWLG